MIIRPAERIEGNINVPGDKSVSHRAAMFAAMADGESRIQNYAMGEDCSSTILCLRQLGVDIAREGSSVVVQGVGKRGFIRPAEPLDCGNSGTTMRLIAGLLAGQGFDSALIGDRSLMSRPMTRIIEPLKLMGAEIEAENGFAPLKISGSRSLKAVMYDMPVASAQVKSCVLIAGLNAAGETRVIEKTQTRDHTERMLRFLGGNLTVSPYENSGNVISVAGSSTLKGGDILVPGDISSAAFFIVAAACLPGSGIQIENVGINGSRAYLLEKLQSFGVDIKIAGNDEGSMEPVADLTIYGMKSQASGAGLTIAGIETAQMIDEIPILAILGTQLAGGLQIRDAKELRIKETDRIAAICENLRRMNADVDEFDDGFRVGRSQLKGTTVDSFGDHRIAMAFAVAGLIAEGETDIVGHQAADVSFPGFYELLDSVVQR